MSSVIYLQTGPSANHVANKNRLLIAQKNKTIPQIVTDSFDGSYGTEVPSWDLTVFENRLNTYRDWKLSFITPAQMANAGLYSLGRQDLVRCVFCSKEFDYWIQGQDPLVEHKRASPDCQFFKEKGHDVCGMFMEYNPTSYKEPWQTNAVHQFMSAVGVQQRNIVLPYNKTFTSYDARLKTFENCKRLLLQDIITLCKAGLFYIGDGATDMMLCFCCNQGLMDWEQNDDPWVEHARWSPNCSFILLSKGKDFVKTVTKDMKPSHSSESSKEIYNNFCIDRSDQALESGHILSGTISLTREESRPENIGYKRLRIIIPRITLSLAHPDPVTLPDALLCKICFKEKIEVLFIPCGHTISCIQCAVTLDHCAICRQQFRMTMRVFVFTRDMGFGNPNQLVRRYIRPIPDNTVENTQCKICVKEDMGVAFVPCRHIYSCLECSLNVKECPVCYEPFFALIQVYL